MINNSSNNKTMRVLGIDPGYERLGIAVVERPDKAPAKESLVYSDCFKTDAKLPFTERLFLIGREIERMIAEYSPDALSMESLFLSTNQKTAMHVAEVRGAILYIARVHDMKICEFTPLQVKLAVAGDGKSSKDQMIKMVRLLLGMNATDGKGAKTPAHGAMKIIDDEYDAIALSLAFFAFGRNK